MMSLGYSNKDCLLLVKAKTHNQTEQWTGIPPKTHTNLSKYIFIKVPRQRGMQKYALSSLAYSLYTAVLQPGVIILSTSQ